MSRRYGLSDPRRPLSPWAAVVALLVCLGIVGGLALLTDDREGMVAYRDAGEDGVARTDNTEVKVRKAYTAPAIVAFNELVRPPDGTFLIVEFDLAALKRSARGLEIAFVNDDKTYLFTLRGGDLNLSMPSVPAGFVTHGVAVFEVPWERIDGGSFVVGPETVDKIKPYRLAARVPLPDPVPRSVGPVTLPAVSTEVRR